MDQTKLQKMLQNTTRRVSNANRQKILNLKRMKLLQYNNEIQSKQDNDDNDHNRTLSILIEKLEKCQMQEEQAYIFDQIIDQLQGQKQLSHNLVQKIVSILEDFVSKSETHLQYIIKILELLSKNYEDIIQLFQSYCFVDKLRQYIEKHPQKWNLLFQFSFILRFLMSKENHLQKQYKQYQYFKYLQPLYQIYCEIISQTDKWELVDTYYKILKGTNIENIINYSKVQYYDNNDSKNLKIQFNQIYEEIIEDIDFSIICINEIAFELYQQGNFEEIVINDYFLNYFCKLYFYFKKNKDTQLSFLELLCDFSAVNKNQVLIDIILIQQNMLNEFIEIIFDQCTQSFFKKSVLIILYNFILISPKYIQEWTSDNNKIEKLINLYFESNGTSFQIDILSLMCQFTTNINFIQWQQLQKIEFDQILVLFFNHFYDYPNKSEMVYILDAIEALLKANQQFDGDLNMRLSEGSFIEQLADLQTQVKDQKTFQKIQNILLQYFEDFI